MASNPRIPAEAELFKTRSKKPEKLKEIERLNADAQRVANYVNKKMANNKGEDYDNRGVEGFNFTFSSIADALILEEEFVRKVLSNGGYNGITYGVTAEDRKLLASYKYETFKR